MAEIWNVPGKHRPSFATRQVRGLLLLLLLLVFALGVITTTALASLAVLVGHSLAFTLANLAASAAVNTGLFLLAFRALTPRQIPTRQLPLGAAVAGVLWCCCKAPGATWSATTSSTPARSTGSSPSSWAAVVAVPGRRGHAVRRRGQRRPRPVPVATQHPATAPHPVGQTGSGRPCQARGAPPGGVHPRRLHRTASHRRARATGSQSPIGRQHASHAVWRTGP